MFGCGGGGGGGGTNTPDTLSIEPANVTIYAGEKLQFSAALGGGPAPNATWSVAAGDGTVNSDGLYSSPNVAGTYMVTVASPGVIAKKATVTVKPALRFVFSAVEQRPGVGFVSLLGVASSSGEYRVLFEAASVHKPYVSPDGTYMFVSSQRPQRPIIWKVDTVTGSSVPIANDNVANYNLRGVDWDQEKLLYNKQYGLPDEIFPLFSANFDGSGEVQLTTATQADVEISPSNSDYFYEEHVPTVLEPEMYVARITKAGADKTRIIPQAFSPAVNPSSTGLVYVDFEPVLGPNAIYDLRAANLDGSGIVNLTNTPGFAEFLPVWTPDGEEILYVRMARTLGTPAIGENQVWLMRADGQQQRQLVDLSSKNFWSLMGVCPIPN